MKNLQIRQVLIFHDKITKATGGSSGVKEIGLVESAINRGLASFAGVDLYESTIMKISVITQSLILNHGLIDGNKRIGVSVMLLLLKMNDFTISYTQDELIDFGLKVASGDLNEIEIEKWINVRLI